MKRIATMVVVLLLATLSLAAQPAKAAVSVSVSIGDPYRGASLSFHSEPRVMVVPGTHVHHVRNFDRDLYRVRNHWYFVEDGFWYRSRSWRGPFRHVHFRAVPAEIRRVPFRYRQHWYAPYRDHDRRWESARARDREYDRDWRRARDEWERDGRRDRDGDRDRDWDRDDRRDRDRRERG